MNASNVDPAEVRKFDGLAARWWDTSGEFKTLHAINPVRLAFVEKRVCLAGVPVLDVGCGGGLLCEALAAAGAEVSGIDASESAIAVARLHQAQSGLQVEYAVDTAERLAATRAGTFDVVTCMELLEHVPAPQVLAAACAQLAKPGAHLFFSTLNRTPAAYLLAVLGAEYVLGVLPKGTHDYRRFIRPSELAQWGRDAGLIVSGLAGVAYNPLTNRARLTGAVDVNYLLHFRKPA